MNRPLAIVSAIVLLAAVGLSTAWAQYQKKQSPFSKPKSYSDYYRQQVRMKMTPVGPRGGATNPAKFTVDKYFYHRPTISPYLNLARPNSSPTSNYYSYVLPEQKRRQAAKQRELAKPKFPTRGRSNPSGTSSYNRPKSGGTSSYYHNWYGGRQAIGLK